MRSLSRRLLFRVFRPRRRDTFFCSAKRKYPKKRRLDCRFFLRSSVLLGVGREGVLPSYRRAASMPRPFGLIPTKPAVLGAANETKATYCVTANNTYTLGIKLSFSTTLSPNSAVEIMVTPVPGFERSAVE